MNKRNIILLELVKDAQRPTSIVKRTIVHANCKLFFISTPKTAFRVAQRVNNQQETILVHQLIIQRA